MAVFQARWALAVDVRSSEYCHMSNVATLIIRILSRCFILVGLSLSFSLRRTPCKNQFALTCTPKCILAFIPHFSARWLFAAWFRPRRACIFDHGLPCEDHSSAVQFVQLVSITANILKRSVPQTDTRSAPLQLTQSSTHHVSGALHPKALRSRRPEP